MGSTMPAKASKTAVDILADKQGEIVSVPAATTIQETVEAMIQNKVGSALVQTGDEYVGIWTERDLLRSLVKPGFDATTARVGDHMSREIPSADHSLNPYELMDRFLGLRVRHLLIVRDEEILGLLSIGDVVRFCLQEKTREFEELKETVNWEYYEEWRTRPR
jgi:signal-transduction protein with cAMP-binding, CBS, and nucleotidyltransferase domain